MNGREMRRKDKLVADVGWIEDVLREGQIAFVALSTLNGDPYALPIGYGYEGGVMYFHGAAAGLKNDMIAENPRASFNVSVGVELVRDKSGAEFTNKYRSVTGFGDIEEITGLEEKNRALSILMRQYKGPHEDMTEERSKRVWVAKLVIREMTGKISGYPKP
ncbi:MAG: pyridoxamine 5'-phosphate oxidase family protein [Synergistaceae bacterium]|jgi:nitroimidazol reductase NimA-like FMN-containing flavoprotein (pyridoxamine 5'-phosphate oxidase superfamily)|nr:pyridoxamine 5'-phosphate oxidase family protein [Synergistaceae bacterium]